MNPDRIPEWIRNGPSLIGRFGGAALVSALACQANTPAQKTAGDNPGDRISGQLHVDSLPSELAFARNVVVDETPTPEAVVTPTPEPTATAAVTATSEPTATPQPDRASLAGGGGPVLEVIVDSKPEAPTVRPCLPGDLTPDKMPKQEFYVSKGAEVKLKARPEPDSDVVAVVGEGKKLQNLCGLKTITTEDGKSLYPRLVREEEDGIEGWITVGQDRVQDTKPNLAPPPPAPTRAPTPIPAPKEEQIVPQPETAGASCTIPDSPRRREFPKDWKEGIVPFTREEMRGMGSGSMNYFGYLKRAETFSTGEMGILLEVLGKQYRFHTTPGTTILIWNYPESAPLTFEGSAVWRRKFPGRITKLDPCALKEDDALLVSVVVLYTGENWQGWGPRIGGLDIHR